MPIPIEFIDGKKTVTVLENNPQVMNALSARLGLSPTLQFYDVYSLDPSANDYLPPVHALLVILPLTPAWDASRSAEDAPLPEEYTGSGPSEPVIWFKQTIGHACGSIGLLHCLINGSALQYLTPGSLALKIREVAIPLKMDDRAKMLYDHTAFLDAHQSVAELGDTIAPDAATGDRLGQHFVSFVKGEDGNLWELEGSRKGPLNRGYLGEESLLSEKGIGLGIGRVIGMERASGGGDLRFSCIALAGGEE
ncbi:related to ubiquitin carboxyl-terminal hydrolase [Rhynchosporium secalis]|uniref:Ubiquitin carboxyl-terminal hydrolase n=1 Tax=Rhynchosporium secalis TaxID=38038 RepID=A0A1E1LY92_RHYSE|nr:related to ubiquitin carboxyl-terminal hydrolase [Rhynchosporium secalis]